jgi:hypothetical protein
MVPRMPKKSLSAKKYPGRSSDVPATQKMLYLVRDELKSDIQSLQYGMGSKFKSMESRFQAMDSKFQAMDSKFQAVDAKFESLMAQIHSVKLLVEEQNARNAIVLDGLTNLFARQDRVEGRMDRLEKDVSGAK